MENINISLRVFPAVAVIQQPSYSDIAGQGQAY